MPFSTLEKLARQLTKISEATLRLYVEGSSVSKTVTTPAWMRKAVDFHLAGLSKGSTVLEIEAPYLEDTLPESYQPGLFSELGEDALKNNTALGLSMQAYARATSPDREIDMLDKNLLHEMAGLAGILEGEGYIEWEYAEKKQYIVLEKEKLQTIKTLEKVTPAPIKTKITGVLDVLKFSGRQLELKLPKDRIRVLLPSRRTPEEFTQYFGKEVAITGKANFNPKGEVLNIELQQVNLASKEDEFFKQMPQPLLPEFNVFEAIAHKRATKLDRLFGRWPGNEDLDEILSEIE